MGVAILEETTQVRAAASTLGAGFDVGSANERAQMISNLFDDHVRKPLNLDSRVLAGLSLIESGGDLDLLAVASEVGLSQDRFRHLFRDEVGIPFSRYLLWARIKRAVWLLRGGGTLTAVLTSAGFSDSAHFSKSFKSLFGIPPSIVLKADGIVDCVPGEQGGIPSIAGG
ncbi:MAG: helix-turn-helix transcriptional regulator [Myxococcota bacterium]